MVYTVEAELGEFDSFDSVLHGKEKRESCCSLLWSLKAASFSCAQGITNPSENS